jgi:hypothetical protein
MKTCDECGHRMLTTEVRWADDGVNQAMIDSCGECGAPLERVPDGFRLNENWIA